MNRIRIAVACVAAAAVAAATVSASAATPSLKAVVGPGFTISLSQGAKKVKSLKPGTYKIVVADKSNIHNFHLIGPGVNKKTSVGAVGTQKWTVKLKKGTYKFVCDPHASIMKGSFKVT